MLCDGDALPLSDPTDVESRGGGRINHLENYFLDERTISKLLEPMTTEGHWLRSPAAIRTALKEVAAGQVSYAAALLAATYFRDAVGNVDLMPSGCNGKSLAELTAMISARAHEEKTRVTTALDDSTIAAHLTETMERLEASLAADTEEWKALVPGKVILGIFCSKTPLQYESFRTAFINTADSIVPNPFAEIIQIFDTFDRAAAIGAAS